MTEQRLDYPAGGPNHISLERSVAVAEWMRRELPALNPYHTFRVEIVRVDGRPVRANVHRYAVNRAGNKVWDPALREVARLDPVEMIVGSEPFPEDGR